MQPTATAKDKIVKPLDERRCCECAQQFASLGEQFLCGSGCQCVVDNKVCSRLCCLDPSSAGKPRRCGNNIVYFPTDGCKVTIQPMGVKRYGVIAAELIPIGHNILQYTGELITEV